MAGNLQAWCKHAFRDTFLTLQVTFALVCVCGGGGILAPLGLACSRKKTAARRPFFPF